MKRLLLAMVLSGIAISGVFADKAVAGFYLDQAIQASYNPLAAQSVTQFYYRLPLIKADGMLWESTKIDFGLINNLSPAYDLVGAFIDIEPIAIFDLALTAQFAGYFDALSYGFVDLLPGYSALLDDASIAQLTQRNAAGYILSAAPTLKIALGPFAALDTFSVTYYFADSGSGFFFERIGNVALGKSDYELLNQAYALVTIIPGLLVGLNDYLLIVPASGYISHRLDAIGIFTTKLQEKLSLYAALMMGTFLADQVYQYTFFLGGQVGITLAL